MAIIGIDPGTSNSAAAVLHGSRPIMIPSAEGITLGGKAFPSDRGGGTLDVTIMEFGKGVPAGTQPDSVLRLAGKGLPHFGSAERGDLFLRMDVHVPERLTRDEQALYELLRRGGRAVRERSR